MSEQPAAKPVKVFPGLLVSSRPNMVRAFAGHYAGQADSAQLMSSITWDEYQANSIEQAVERLASGHTATGKPHYFCFIDGQLALDMKPADLERLRKASANLDLIVMGIATGGTKGYEALVKLGVLRIVPADGAGRDFTAAMTQAVADRKRAIEERARAQREAIERPLTEIAVRDLERSGLLRDGGIIVVHSTKGGVGKSTISANIAYALARAGQPTILVDFNPDSGEHHINFRKFLEGRGYKDPNDLFAEAGLAKLAYAMENRAVKSLPAEEIERNIITIWSDGAGKQLDMLPGIRTQQEFDSPAVKKLMLKGEWAMDLFDKLRSANGGYRYVVVDTGTTRDNAFADAAFRKADLFLLVVGANSEKAIRTDEESMAEFIASGKMTERCHRLVVANRYVAPGESPFAHSAKEIAERFAFFKAADVQPVADDGLAMAGFSEHKGTPLLAEETDPTWTTRAVYRNLQELVNRILVVYTENGKPIVQPKSGRKLPFFGRRS